MILGLQLYLLVGFDCRVKKKKTQGPCTCIIYINNIMTVPNISMIIMFVDRLNGVLEPHPIPSIEKAKLETKDIPSHFIYAFLGANES